MTQQSQTLRSILRNRLLLLLLVLLPSYAFCQHTKVVSRDDSIPFCRGVAVSVDAVGLIQRVVSDYGQAEARLRVNVKDKYFPVLELGYGKADAENVTTGLTYKTAAPYFRLGVDCNMLKNKHDIYRLYLGARYSFTAFKYDVSSVNMSDPVWSGDQGLSIKDASASYHWLECSFGVDAKLFGPLRLGWSVRYRRRLVHKDGDYGTPWYVPGYGRSGGARLGGTFDLIFEI